MWRGKKNPRGGSLRSCRVCGCVVEDTVPGYCRRLHRLARHHRCPQHRYCLRPPPSPSPSCNSTTQHTLRIFLIFLLVYVIAFSRGHTLLARTLYSFSRSSSNRLSTMIGVVGPLLIPYSPFRLRRELAVRTIPQTTSRATPHTRCNRPCPAIPCADTSSDHLASAVAPSIVTLEVSGRLALRSKPRYMQEMMA